VLAADLALVLIHDRSAYRQSEAKPVDLGREEGIEQARPVGLGNTPTSILDFHPHA
jgi:hypothetical protein